VTSEDRPTITAIEIIALALSLVWVLGILVLFFGLDLGASIAATGGAGLGIVMILLAVFLPIALIWVAASVARTARVMREEADRLQGAISAMRETVLAQARAGGAVPPTVARKIDQIAETTRQTETALVTFASSRTGTATPPSEAKAALADPPPPRAGVETQRSLGLDTPPEDMREPISVSEFIRAANFPETAEDKEGFRALRRALEDRDAGKLIRSAQDVLTLLSEDGIYMDDLTPDRAKPEAWRRFAEGQRGRAVAALGGIRDRSCLALTAARMKSDPIFRDSVHHFLRHFDRTFSAFAQHATDAEIVRLADTRTARAFMLLGRVTKTFE
jgi:type II secretory pathway pseudopilin PulG